MNTASNVFPVRLSLSKHTLYITTTSQSKGHKVAPGITKRLDVGVCVCVTAVPGGAGEIKITKKESRAVCIKELAHE